MLTGKHLEAYLAHVVLGRKLPQRGRIGPRPGPPRKGPARDEEYKAWIRTLSMKASDYSCIPLCADCHTRGALAYHRIGKHAFERVHCLRFALIAARLKREWKARARAA
jgi:hypothetical protein